MKTVTNYIVSSTRVSFTERFILPQFRERMNKLLSIAEKRGYEPLLVVGRDGKWWNDELDFILDRMSDGNCCGDDPLFTWVDAINTHPLVHGETRSFVYSGDTYTVKADTTDLSNDGVLTNNCEPVEEDECKANKYTVWLSFEANVEINADNETDAIETAYRMLEQRRVVDWSGTTDSNFSDQEPHIIETNMRK